MRRAEMGRGEKSHFEIMQIVAISDFLYKYNEFDNH
jgi:hypothetical protein